MKSSGSTYRIWYRPHIEKAARQEVGAIGERKADVWPRIVVLDAAVLLEAGWEADEIWVVIAPREVLIWCTYNIGSNRADCRAG